VIKDEKDYFDITLILSGMRTLLGGAPYKYRREPKSIKIYKGRRR